MFWKFKYPEGSASGSSFPTQEAARDCAVYSKSQMEPQKWSRVPREQRDQLWNNLEREGYKVEVAS
tara:strand:- start:660 stop:857 length:198 start_codon:yes stop_codon:yes gene_type:complete